MTNQNWKRAEKCLRDIYLKYKIPAERMSRGGNFAVSTYDVRLTDPNLPVEFTNDSKYTQAKPFRHHGLIKTIAKKYCSNPDQYPVLYTKNYSKTGGGFSVPDFLWAGLVSYFFGYMTKEEVLEEWLKESLDKWES